MMNGIQAYQNYEIFLRSFQSLKSHDAQGHNIHQTMSGIFAATNIQLSQSLVEKEIGNFMEGFKTATTMMKSVVDSYQTSNNVTSTDAVDITSLNNTQPSINLEVTQLAQSQLITSDQYESDSNSLINSSRTTFDVQIADESYSFSFDSSEMQDNRTFLETLSENINKQTPLTSRVIENDNQVSIEVEYDQTGEDNAFTITSGDTPLRFTYTREARDLLARIDDMNYRSASNTIVTDNFIFNFKRVLAATDVKIETDQENLVAQRNSAVESLNNMEDFLRRQNRSQARDEALQRVEDVQNRFEEISNDIYFENAVENSPDYISDRFESFIEEVDQVVQDIEETPISQFFVAQEPYFQLQQTPSTYYNSLFSGNSIDLTI